MRQAKQTRPTETRCALYARMSKDNPYGIARQLEDARAKAAELGWQVVGQPYVDDGVSAADKRRVRPGYQRLLTDVRAGKLDAVVCWDLDRLTRQPRELEDWADLAEDAGVQVAAVTGHVDLLTPSGLLSAGIKGQVARSEVRQTKLRMSRALAQRATSGKPHGRVPYGWQAELFELGRYVDSRGVERVQRRRIGDDRIDPAAADVVRSTARRLLSGESLRSIVADLNARGVRSPRGGTWSQQVLRQIMLRESNAGRREHRGEVVGQVTVRPALLDEGTHDRVVALLTDPSRVTNLGRPRAHLLSMLAVCGKCGSDSVTVNPGRTADPAKGRRAEAPGYACRSCYGMRKLQAPVDEYVCELMIERLSRPDAAERLAAPDRSGEVAAARERIDEIEATLDRAVDSLIAGRINQRQLDRLNAGFAPELTELRAKVAAAMPRADLADLAGPEAAAKWADAPLDVRRAAINALMTVTLHPSGPGRRAFDPATVEITWRKAR